MPKPLEETSDETELDRRVWPVAEKRDRAGEAGADEFRVRGD